MSVHFVFVSIATKAAVTRSPPTMLKVDRRHMILIKNYIKITIKLYSWVWWKHRELSNRVPMQVSRTSITIIVHTHDHDPYMHIAHFICTVYISRSSFGSWSA